MEKREKFSKAITLVFTLCFLWSFIQFLAPVILPSSSVTHLDGYTGLADNIKTIENISFPWDILYAMGDRLCHQKMERSLIINNNQMPFCIRCTSIWIGIVIGLGVLMLYKIQLNGRFAMGLIIGIIPVAVDGFGQLLGIWESTTVLRALTGLLAGFMSGVAIGVIIDELHSFRKA
jgi:uncharacterized membrane protein